MNWETPAFEEIDMSAEIVFGTKAKTTTVCEPNRCAAACP